jgi:hypothetical protein
MRSEKKRIYRKAKMQFGASAGILDLAEVWWQRQSDSVLFYCVKGVQGLINLTFCRGGGEGRKARQI